MNAGTILVPGAVVTPYRFTDRPRELVAFLELLGMRAFLRQNEFVVLAGRSGRIAVHPRATANDRHQATSLVLGVPDAVTAVDALSDAGFDATWWDESWGRQARVPSPVGELTLDSETADPYGYDLAESPEGVRSGVDVVATLYVDEAAAIAAYFGAFGFRRDESATPECVPLRAEPGSGILGLLVADRGTAMEAPADGPASTEIGLETTEPLDSLAARLGSGGHLVEVIEDSGPRHLVVADPDGIEVEVYAADD